LCSDHPWREGGTNNNNNNNESVVEEAELPAPTLTIASIDQIGV